MKKIFEFVEDYNTNKQVLKYLDELIFFDEIWMFADGDKEFISMYIEDIIPLDDFIKLGNKICDNLNKMNISISDYNPNDLIHYLK